MRYLLGSITSFLTIIVLMAACSRNEQEPESHAQENHLAADSVDHTAVEKGKVSLGSTRSDQANFRHTDLSLSFSALVKAKCDGEEVGNPQAILRASGRGASENWCPGQI